MEVKLKQGQKLCKNCNDVNPIRSFNCKSCKFVFIQKTKEKSNDKIKNESAFNIKSNGVNDELVTDIEPPILIYLTNKVSSLINKSNIKNSCKSDNMDIEKDIDNNLYNIEDFLKIEKNNNNTIDEINIKIVNPIVYDYNIESSYFNNTDTLLLIFIIFKRNEQSTSNSAYTYYIITFQICINNTTNIFNQEEIKISSSSIKKYLIQHEIVSTKIKILTQSLFIVSVNNIINFFYMNNTNNNTNKLEYNINANNNLTNFHSFEIVSKNLTDLSNHYISCFDTEINNNTIKLIISDSSYKIFYYICKQSNIDMYNLNNSIINNNKTKLFQIVMIYDNFFTSKITDIKFIRLFDPKDNTENNNNSNGSSYFITKSYFIACSRDCFIKLFDTFNQNDSIFKYKSTDIWINKLLFDEQSQIIFFIVNLKEKIYGIKFSCIKEPLIKKVPHTFSSIYSTIDIIYDKFLYLDSQGQIYFHDLSFIDKIFSKSKSKIVNEVSPKLLYKYQLDNDSTSNSNNLFYPTKFNYFSCNKNDKNIGLLIVPNFNCVIIKKTSI